MKLDEGETLIKFVMVHPKNEELDLYLDNIVDKLNNNNKIVKSCSAYEKSELLYKIKLDTANGNTYFFEIEMATYNKSKHLFVSIFPQKINYEFDKDLYSVKFLFKDLLRKDWEECIWLLDDQSSQYANELYSDIHNVENKLRQFISIVMIRYFGINWWGNYAPKKIKDKYQARQGGYKRVAKLYANVSDKLLSIDTEDLILIMTHKIKKFKEEGGTLVVKLLESLKETGDLSTVAAEYKRLVNELRNECEIEIDIWTDIFNKYFNDEFIKEWEEFSKNRNHVAHNKLLDTDAYGIIKNSIQVVQVAIEDAEKKFNEISLSDEEKEKILELEAMREIENEMLEMSRMEEESGVRILDAGSIFERFNETVSEFIESIVDSVYFRSDLDTSTTSFDQESSEEELLIIKSKLNDSELKLIATIFLDENPGNESSLNIKLIIDGEKFDECEMTYRNGEAILDKEHNYYMPLNYNEFNDGDFDDFISNIESNIEELFPNLVDEVDLAKSSAIRDGGNYPVADFPCEECGESYVCIDSSLEQYGKCVNCGHMHDVNQCERCETNYNESIEGNSMFCESCYEWFERQ